MEEGRREGEGRGAAAAPGAAAAGDGGAGGTGSTGGTGGGRPHRNMAGAEPFGAVLGALRGCYAQVAPLETFVRGLGESGAEKAEVVRDSDAASYGTFVSQCVVCVPHGARDIPRPFSLEQLSSQSEVISRVMQRLCGKKKKNILTYGYSLLDENSSHFQIMPLSNVYSYLPNTATETMRISGLWETLLSRIGDDVMMYLLEHCAIFMLVPPSNCYQVCGQPIYELISQNVESAPEFVKQRLSKHKRSSLLKYMQKRLTFHRQYLSKSRQSKRRQRLEANVSSVRNKTSNNIQSLGSAALEKQSSSNAGLSATAPSLKRKLAREQLEVTAKRARLEEKEREEQACNTAPNVNQSIPKRYGTGCVASRSVSLTKEKNISQRSNSDMSRPSLVHNSHRGKKSVADKSSFLQGAESNRHLKPSIEMQAGSSRKGVETRRPIPRLDWVPIEPAESSSSGHKKQEGPLAHLAEEVPNRVLPSTIYIDRKFLYSRRYWGERFPKSFLLNRLKGSQAGVKRLIETIFLSQNPFGQKCNQGLPQKKRRKKKLPKRFWRMRSIFQQLLKNHGKFPYVAFLRQNCPLRISDTILGKAKLLSRAPLPGQAEARKQAEQLGKEPAERVASSRCESGHTNVPSSVRAPLAASACGEPGGEEQIPAEASDSVLRELLKEHCSHFQVYLFVRECVERVIPTELWGSNHNKRRFFKNVKAFISMGKYAKLSLQVLMWKMRVNDCMWLRLAKGNHFVPASEHLYREEILAKFLYWLMDTYVVQLLRSFFYVTETMFQKNMLFYYRKCIWGKLQDIGIRKHFSKVKLRPLTAEEMEAIHQKKYLPMASKLRFIPKVTGLRPIVRMSGVVEAQTLSKESRAKKMNHYNMQLKNLFSVLNYERTINTSYIGSSVFGRDDIYKSWKTFVKKVLKSDGEIPHFYYVKADVSRAFDSIPHNKLVEVISQVLKPEKKTVYCIRRYAVVMITGSGKTRKLYKRHVSTFKDFMPDMKQFVSRLHESTSLRDAIIVEQSLTFNETSASLFNFFLQMLNNNILEIERSYYLQCSGIPQGSLLSTLLCSLCYGDMENKLFSGVQKDGVLIRLIDDFLLVTPHLTHARTFLRTLAMGIPEYGFLINPKKTVVNFSADDIPECSEFKQLPNCRLIPWCGLLLDTQTLEVYCDYSSYSCTSIRSSLSFNSNRTAGKNMKHKLLAVLKLKCHGLFLDLQINSLKTVFINVYKIFLLQAYRFHACVIQLPFNQKVRNNPDFFLRVIAENASCCYSMLKAKNPGFTLGNRGASGMFPSEAAEWLCYHAFTVKLSNHKVVYKCLLKPLKFCHWGCFKTEALAVLCHMVTVLANL
uniref:Telomerase reverse transcriptase n=1 Tax=Anas platyrhynchos platyrhynchos TaxID=8840 RepID=A0A493TGE5_ANAPP